MSAHKHTPGPWELHESVTHVRVVAADGENIWFEDKRCPRVIEDARLIAAAPELLEAFMAMLEWDDREKDHAVDFYARMDLCRAAFDKARAAIAKATGEPA